MHFDKGKSWATRGRKVKGLYKRFKPFKPFKRLKEDSLTAEDV